MRLGVRVGLGCYTNRAVYLWSTFRPQLVPCPPTLYAIHGRMAEWIYVNVLMSKWFTLKICCVRFRTWARAHVSTHARTHTHERTHACTNAPTYTHTRKLCVHYAHQSEFTSRQTSLHWDAATRRSNIIFPLYSYQDVQRTTVGRRSHNRY